MTSQNNTQTTELETVADWLLTSDEHLVVFNLEETCEHLNLSDWLYVSHCEIFTSVDPNTDLTQQANIYTLVKDLKFFSKQYHATDWKLLDITDGLESIQVLAVKPNTEAEHWGQASYAAIHDNEWDSDNVLDEDELYDFRYNLLSDNGYVYNPDMQAWYDPIECGQVTDPDNFGEWFDPDTNPNIHEDDNGIYKCAIDGVGHYWCVESVDWLPVVY